MCESMTQLQMQGYKHLPGFLDKDNCAELTAELKRIVARTNDRTIKLRIK